MHFTKMHGLGNDYLYVYDEVPANIADLSIRLSERHFGVGSDGMIYISPSEIADFKMRIFNADGSEAKMCGNGIRCVGKYVYDKALTRKTSLTIETLSGIKTLDLQVIDGVVRTATVGMGQAVVEDDRQLDVQGTPVTCTPVSVGNPHAVIFQEEVENYDVAGTGPAIEHHPRFINRTNTEFAKVLSRERIRMRVWERGAGETLACGTGACATLAAAAVNGLTERKAVLELNGGPLLIEWDEKTNHVFQEGPAEFVFEGEWENR